MEFKSEYYNETQIDSFIISYGFKEGKIENKNIVKTNLTLQNYKNNNLVISFNPLDFGKVINITKLANETLYILQDKDNLIIKLLNSENQNSIEIFKDGDLILKFNDFKISENRFVRILENKKFYFENNKEILYTKEINSKYISKLEKSKKLINNFITLDIETYIKDNILIPFCISIYDGKRTFSYFISDFKDPKDLIITALKSILVRKYNGFNVYIHNMAKFDIIFLLKYLVKLGNVVPIIHNGRIISINLNFGKDLEYRLNFKDSYLILLASLANLAKGFGVETLKSIFPFLFVNENNLNYTGPVPDFKYFGNKISRNEYQDYKSKFDNN
jgi:DNA polymerase type B, organellar and viral